MLLEVPNIKLYSFHNDFDLICDLTTTKTTATMASGSTPGSWSSCAGTTYLLTQDNYQTYWMKCGSFTPRLTTLLST